MSANRPQTRMAVEFGQFFQFYLFGQYLPFYRGHT